MTTSVISKCVNYLLQGLEQQEARSYVREKKGLSLRFQSVDTMGSGMMKFHLSVAMWTLTIDWIIGKWCNWLL